MQLKKILLAEDDHDDQYLFTDLTKHRNDLLLMPIAGNGDELLDYLDTLADDDLPCLIVLDQNMPKKNGLQTLQELKNNERFAHIPVMLYTTYADKELLRIGDELGAATIVPKPVTKNGYDEMLNMFLNFI